MELKVAKTDLQSKKGETKISIDEVLKQYKEEGKHIFYFDGQNPHKDMQKAQNTIQKAGYRVQLNEVRYGLYENNYIYEIHIV